MQLFEYVDRRSILTRGLGADAVSYRGGVVVIEVLVGLVWSSVL